MVYSYLAVKAAKYQVSRRAVAKLVDGIPDKTHTQNAGRSRCRMVALAMGKTIFASTIGSSPPYTGDRCTLHAHRARLLSRYHRRNTRRTSYA